MPRYLSQHTLACMTRQGVTELVRQAHAATEVAVTRALLNMQEGKLWLEIEAPDRTEIEKWFAARKFHSDWLLRIEFESMDGEMHPT